jgi:hypothetical protein
MCQRLQLDHDEELSNFAFNFNLRRFTTVAPQAWVEDEAAPAPASPTSGAAASQSQKLEQRVPAGSELEAFFKSLPGRGLHSSKFRLNESAFYGMGGALRGC